MNYLLEKRGIKEEYKKRVKIVLLGREGYLTDEISVMVNIHPKSVRKWIKRFNEKGMEGLMDKPRGGAPCRFTEKQREEIIKISLSDPRDLGLPFTNWSSKKNKKIHNREEK